MPHSQGEIDTDDSDLANGGRNRRRLLDRPERIRREVNRLYWGWREGATTAEDAARMAGVLKTLHTLLVGPALEQRLAEVERRLAELSQP